MRFKIVLAVLFSLFGSPQSKASFFYTPIGHREAFLGNAGSALPCSSGSSIYNPAGLGFCENFVDISVSGTSIAYQETEGPVFANESGSLKSSTLLTSAIFSVDEKTHMGFYYAYPTNTQDFFRFTATNETRSDEIARQAALAGISYGGLISSELAWGFSIGMTWNELNTTSVQSSTSGGNASLLTERRLQTENYIALNPGLLWHVNDRYNLGLTLQWRALNIYSEGTLYQMRFNSGQTEATEEYQNYTPHTDPVFGLTLGQSFHVQQNTLLFDISYAPQYALASTPERLDQDLQMLSISLGLQGPFVMSTSYMAGVSYSSMGRQKIYLATAGISINRRTLDANLGLYYQYSENRNVGGLNSDILGFLYSSSLNY